MTKSEIEKARRELDHALGAFEEWARGSGDWQRAAQMVAFSLFPRHRLAGSAFWQARDACLVGPELTRLEGVRYMRRLAPVFLDLLIEREDAEWSRAELGAAMAEAQKAGGAVVRLPRVVVR